MADRNHTERVNFGKLREVIQPPNLIEIQITSYLDFLQNPNELHVVVSLGATTLWDVTVIDNTTYFIELTVPQEKRLKVSHDSKTAKYSALALSRSNAGRPTKVLAVEVSTKGFLNPSTLALGKNSKGPFLEKTANALRNAMSIRAIQGSWKIWCARHSPQWTP